MLQLEQAKLSLGELCDGIKDLGDSIGFESLKTEVEELENKTAEAGFWDKPQESQVVLKQLKFKKGTLERYIALKRSFDDVETLIDIAIEEDDESIVDEVLADLEAVNKEYERQKIEILLSGEYDGSNAIVSIHPGAGGTEAQDWAQMLYRMYMHYAEKKGFKFKVLDYLDGDEAGIKSVSFLVEGINAYGYLKSESGVHRLVRVSPFDSSGRRHTSFASVEVLPEFNDEITIEINEADLKIDAHRASGAGGQHVNKTDSAIRITHIPTGIVVGCQTERSQVQNRETAMKMLKSKLLEIKEREHLERVEDITGTKMNIEWGSQIRSYVFMPYTLVKDNRTGCETGNIQAVMDGDLDEFINEYLKLNCNK
ncbi:MAG: peptide chain release factor 2 [Clostridia bacterium]|nr:peptide chain release factor 2 [Clostridia bacterium]